ncbi:dicarboxylate/amino acid:cation symporter [Hoylesella loescheii]|uniref:Transporter, dicarboxylate/amino acid:cation Na+/H+ symporter family protein n=1 Tax=Hoylesella loescheii DSM 19665 = JCM 12249 = ATCC 15930 TaxID=1122985 RepID=A0A069QMC7_HOYLO|nr:dicarboxylate/amino acid:cation symporter [Hoylesella loescheii]KDR50996.1 transporter, dicarboxylate/amino acid:cation Na+/H+ symporter family protein [Hoylesella loescheii DSM 19665 = JCM 12249 = ATCC 15930]
MKIGLLGRILIAIALGVALGHVFTLPWVRIFVTFNSIFGQFLGFIIPLIILGLVTPAIADIGKGAGKLLLITVGIAYADTVIAAILSYTTGTTFFPSLIGNGAQTLDPVEKSAEILPYFTVNIPAALDVMSALVLSFIMGLGIAYGDHKVLRDATNEMKAIIVGVIERVIIPLLPVYIFGIFLNMTFSGDVMRMMTVFAKIIVVIFALHIFVLIYQYLIAGAIVRRNPFRLLANMFPAYLTALGTSSSAATIPVALKQTRKNGVSEGVAGFVIPLCATVHLSGSAMKITACAFTIALLEGMPTDFPLFLHFIMVLAIFMVAAPGVPGGAVMAALAPLGSILGFGENEQALMIALYIAMDSFGTACNVTGDGAIALVVDKLNRKKDGVKEEAA